MREFFSSGAFFVDREKKNAKIGTRKNLVPHGTLLRLDTRVTFQRRGQFLRPLACSFPSTIPERKERPLVV